MSPASPLNLSFLKVLLVEDDPLMRGILEDFFVERGVKFCSFTTADDALVAALQGPKPDLLVTDHLMPGQLSGADLAGMLASRWPELLVVITTGYGYGITADLPPGTVYLQKPWMLADLDVAITQALQQKNKGEASWEPPCVALDWSVKN